MKKLGTLLMVPVMMLAVSFAQFVATPDLEDKVDQAGDVLITIVETKFDANYELLLGAIMSFQEKVADDEKKTWILDRLVDIINSRINELSHDDRAMLDDEIEEEVEGIRLTHVAVGSTIRGVSFDGMESAQGSLVLEEGKSKVTVIFDGLADPAPDNFYEGWLVRKSPFHFVSTGPLTYVDGQWINERIADEDISDHNHYVLTLEPNDDDPAPADHIFEGDL